jgi:hypothetical protein
MQDACRGGSTELPLSLIRVGLTSATLRAAPAASALVEALVLQMLAQRAPAAPKSPARAGPGSHGGGWGLRADRQASGEEQVLQSAAEEVCTLFQTP